MNGSKNSSGEISESLKKARARNRITEKIRVQIKRILNIGLHHSFPKCPGKKNRCKHTAGHGTSGDFYGLGDTGHFGVGYCYYHEVQFTEEKKLEVARRQMEAMRAFGMHNIPPNEYEELAKVQASEIKKYNEIQRGLDLVIKTLKEFESKVANKDEPLTEYISGGKEGAVLATASDVTRMDLACRLSKCLASIKLDEFKMAQDSYVHESEIISRLPQEMALTKRMFSKLVELKANFKEGNRDPVEEVYDEYRNGMKAIWKDAKTGEKR